MPESRKAELHKIINYLTNIELWSKLTPDEKQSLGEAQLELAKIESEEQDAQD